MRGYTTSSSQDQQQQQQQLGHEQAGLLKPQMRKQTRRRVHTSRPYQERLLNMAEARREIVTALRIHRANMKQQPKKEQRQPRLQQPVKQVMFQDQIHAFEGVPPAVAMSYVSSSSSSTKNHLCSSSFPLANLIAGVAAPAGNYSSSPMLSYDLTPVDEEEPAATAIVGSLEEQLAYSSLPAQPLGLNLSFHGFGGALLDNVKNSDNNPFGVPLMIQPSSCHPSSYPAYYSSPVTAAVTEAGHGYSSAALNQLALLDGGDGEMSSCYSIGSDGERRGAGESSLSETDANVAAASAWWTKILESGGGGESAGTITEAEPAGVVDVYDDVVVAAGLPEWQWLCDGVEQEAPPWQYKPDILLERMHADDGDHSGCYEGDHLDNGGDDIALLPCMDIGDIEGWDDGAEWFP